MSSFDMQGHFAVKYRVAREAHAKEKLFVNTND